MIYKAVKVKDIIHFLGDEVVSVYGSVNDDLFIDNIPDVNTVNETSLDWINSSKENKQSLAENSKAKVLVVDGTIQYSSSMEAQKKVLLAVKKPRRTMAHIASQFFVAKQEPGIHPSAVVDPEAVVDEESKIYRE